MIAEPVDPFGGGVLDFLRAAPRLADTSSQQYWDSPETVEASAIGVAMSEKRKKYDREFREGAVRIVEETGKSIAAVARDLGIHEGTLGNWVTRDREAREGRGELTRDDIEELKRLRSENAELRMERDVLKRSVVLPVKEATK
jgi:transposase